MPASAHTADGSPSSTSRSSRRLRSRDKPRRKKGITSSGEHQSNSETSEGTEDSSKTEDDVEFPVYTPFWFTADNEDSSLRSSTPPPHRQRLCTTASSSSVSDTDSWNSSIETASLSRKLAVSGALVFPGEESSAHQEVSSAASSSSLSLLLSSSSASSSSASISTTSLSTSNKVGVAQNEVASLTDVFEAILHARRRRLIGMSSNDDATDSATESGRFRGFHRHPFHRLLKLDDEVTFAYLCLLDIPIFEPDSDFTVASLLAAMISDNARRCFRALLYTDPCSTATIHRLFSSCSDQQLLDYCHLPPIFLANVASFRQILLNELSSLNGPWIQSHPGNPLLWSSSSPPSISTLCQQVCRTTGLSLTIVAAFEGRDMQSRWEAHLSPLQPLLKSIGYEFKLRVGPGRVFLRPQSEQSPAVSPSPPLSSSSSSSLPSESIVSNVPLGQAYMVSNDLAMWILDFDHELSDISDLFLSKSLVQLLMTKLAVNGQITPTSIAIVDLTTIDNWDSSSTLNTLVRYVGLAFSSHSNLYHTLNRIFDHIKAFNNNLLLQQAHSNEAEASLTSPSSSTLITSSRPPLIESVALWPPFASSAVPFGVDCDEIIFAMSLFVIHRITDAPYQAWLRSADLISRGCWSAEALTNSLASFPRTLADHRTNCLDLVLLKQLVRPDFTMFLSSRTNFTPKELAACAEWLLVQDNELVATLFGSTVITQLHGQRLPLHLVSRIQKNAGRVFSWIFTNCPANVSAARSVLFKNQAALLLLLTMAQRSYVTLHRHLPRRYLSNWSNDAPNPTAEGVSGAIQFATIRLHERTDVALKVFKPETLANPQGLADARTEVSLLSILHHPHIVSMFGANLKRPNFSFIALEKANCDLQVWLDEQTVDLGFEVIRSIALNITSALMWLHSLGIVHRDLKPKNCLVFSSHRSAEVGPLVKLCDFGSGKLNHNPYQWSKGVGTLFWLAPEILRGESPLTAQVDVYSMALILFQLATRELPFTSWPEMSIAHRVANGERPDIKRIAPKLRTLIKQCWAPKPKRRPTSELLFKLLGQL